MSFRRNAEAPDLNPLLIWGQRFLIVILFLLSGLILIADRLFPGQATAARTATTDILAPMVDLAGAPVRWSKQGIQGFYAFINTTELASRAQNLSAERDLLQLKLAQRDALIAELQANINLPPEKLGTFITARVLLRGDSLFANSLVLNVGSRDRRLVFDQRFADAFTSVDSLTGLPQPFNDPCADQNGPSIPAYCRTLEVRDGLAVVTRQGILGRLQTVGQNSSRVRLITSQDSALPVLVGEFRIRGTAFGNDTHFLTLLADGALPGSINIGDVVLTSNIDPDIPFLFRVGEVVQVNPEIQIRPSAVHADGVDNFVQVALKEPLDVLGAGPPRP